ncbi:hypothetical protein I4F81_008653 [Pyropia yezoensis]|uniref:Uncharacterized protein n=1 Tax=Pyropia yezoensis TaxID=2788 RepID=A0ACC3C8Q0_PYRYE|nr:hypothetical protein I4F81_008653 [Neopyropia yezoensis]
MAGSGKTTLLQALAAHLGATDTPAYLINVDPAVADLPYEPNIDIRDTVDYGAVMEDYQLGPNGAILTALNLFATRFDQVLDLVTARAPDVDYVLVDTPGQIETFTWSASGAIISEALAAALPTVVLFVVDTQRASSPMTFVSNMLYACSVLYKTRLPLVVVWNKVDVAPAGCAQGWMGDYDGLSDAIGDDPSFAGGLARSMALTLEVFYEAIRSVGVSALTGEGLPALLAAIADAAAEYEREVAPDVAARAAAAAAAAEERQQGHLASFRPSATGHGATSPTPPPR